MSVQFLFLSHRFRFRFTAPVSLVEWTQIFYQLNVSVFPRIFFLVKQCKSSLMWRKAAIIFLSRSQDFKSFNMKRVENLFS